MIYSSDSIYKLYINLALQFGGFRLPFISAGVLTTLLGIVCVFTIPRQKGW